MQSTNIQQLLDQADSAPSNVQAYADHIIKNEGGFIDTPYDPGGATNYGLSFRFVNLSVNFSHLSVPILIQ